MKAIKVQDGETAAVVEAPIPQLRPGWLLCQTKAVGINPTDWKHIERPGYGSGATVGCDFAGEVVDVGQLITQDFKRGDRVACVVHGANNLQHEDGAYGEYAVCKADLAFKIPDSLTYEDAATLPVAAFTCGQGMYEHMKLPLPELDAGHRRPILIYGASGSTGMAACQLAKLSGFEVLAVCSPHNFALVESLGADKVYNYKDTKCAETIRKDTGNNLFYAFDCISTQSSMTFCYDALSTEALSPSGEPPKYGAIVPGGDRPRTDVKYSFTFLMTIVGDKIDKGPRPFEDNSKDFEFGKAWTVVIENLLAKGKLKPLKKEVREGGLDRVLDGIADVKAGKNSGVKLVYSIA